ncbi:tail fiber domain-containing protein [Psychroserpens sp. XS_ASV72]|uniref:tail fiber domain-containing protein n=1 Tax=Psychroserpens sp. XS_ASV72 TaxID=3241293 RepID=UPI003514D5DD
MKVRLSILICMFFCCVNHSIAQVGINTTNPKAQLEIQSSNVATPSNTDGILIPKIDEYPVTNPTAQQDGMLVYVTGNGSVFKGFYYWDNTTTSWISLSGASIEKINDLLDGKSDNDGSDNGSSIFLGINAGANDDESNNHNVGIGPNALRQNSTGSNNTAIGNEAMIFNSTGFQNTALGQKAMNFNTSGINNTAIGHKALRDNTTGTNNTVIGVSAGENLIGSSNVILGYYAGYNSAGDNHVFLGRFAGYNETNSNRLYIENSSSVTPLIYGEFDNDFLRINGDFEIEKSTNASATVVTPFGYQSSLKLFERGTGGDYGFEFQYDGSPDKLYLWSRTFAGNEGIRMTWLKDGKVGLNDTSPDARLDIEVTDRNAPLNTDGLLVPRINNFPSTNPGILQDGMLVYLTSDDSFYFWDHGNTNWQKLSQVERIDDLVDGRSDTNGSSVFLGVGAGINDNGTDNRNVAIGYQSMTDNITGIDNTALGYQSLTNNISGDNNSAIGYHTLYSNSTGRVNVAHGSYALYDNTNGNYNVAMGSSALENNTSGDYNTAIGASASLSVTVFDNTTALGYQASPNSPNQVRLGNSSVAVIGGYANWSNFSDRRLKTNIKENVVGLDFIKRLRPVSYHYDMDAIARFENIPDSLRLKDAERLKAAEVQTGFIAQEVESAANAVGFDFHGVIIPYDENGTYALRYAEFVVPLVKAIQEQQDLIEAQQEELTTLRREIEGIKALLKKE